jgi:Molecular chaperone (small heat shock protein)
MANDIQKYNDDEDMRRVGTFEDFFDSMMNAWGMSNTKIPPVDIEEKKDGYVLSAEMPGLNDKDINVYVEKHVLHIESLKKADNESEKKEEGRKYLVRERSTTSFERSFTLPEDAKVDEIAASFKDGMLTLNIPKVAQAQPRRIEIKAN